MTTITCSIFKSGTTTPVPGYVRVVAVDEIPSTTVFYAVAPVDYPLVAGVVTFDLVPSDVAKVSYTFSIYQTDISFDSDLLLNKFDATVPFSATPINLATLAQQSGLRYDRRDASLLTLARYLTSNDSFLGFLGDYLWKNKGTWNVTTIYKRGDVVLRNGSSYQYVAMTQQSGLIPENNPEVWTLLVSGSTGGGGSTPATIPVGTMLLYPTAATVPTGFLDCDGTAVSRTTYATLFSAIGTTYGSGNGTTTFNLPLSTIGGSSRFIVNISGLGGGTGNAATPVATMLLYPTSATVPAGHLRCDNSAVSRSTYSTLFSLIGTTYGAGNGSSTFNIPDSPIIGDSSFIVVAS